MNDLGPILDEALGHARERVPGEDPGAVAFDTATVLAHILASGQESASIFHVSDLNILSASVKVAQNVLSRNLHRQWLINPGSHPVAGCGTRMTLGDILRVLAERLPDAEPTTADYQRVAAVLADLTLFTKGWAPIEIAVHGSKCFRSGAVVQLKSGGPLMTVRWSDSETTFVNWFDGAEHNSAEFKTAVLHRR